MVNNADLKLKYEGSVKNVFAAQNDPNSLWFSFTDKYSVFDWGQMPDLIANKGNSLALIGSYIFQKLADAKFWQTLPQSAYLKKFDSAYLQSRFNHPVFSSGLKKNGLTTHFLGLYEGIGESKSGIQKLKELCHKDALDLTKPLQIV